MKRFLVVLGIVIALLASKPRVVTISPQVTTPLPTPPAAPRPEAMPLSDMVRFESVSIGVNPAMASCIVTHESRWVPSERGDDGNSRGLWQISNIWHPEVSNAVAFSPVSSTIWSLYWIKSGHVGQWTTYWEFCTSLSIF